MVTPRSMPMTSLVPGASTGAGDDRERHVPLAVAVEGDAERLRLGQFAARVSRKRTQPQPGTLT